MRRSEPSSCSVHTRGERAAAFMIAKAFWTRGFLAFFFLVSGELDLDAGAASARFRLRACLSEIGSKKSVIGRCQAGAERLRPVFCESRSIIRGLHNSRVTNVASVCSVRVLFGHQSTRSSVAAASCVRALPHMQHGAAGSPAPSPGAHSSHRTSPQGSHTSTGRLPVAQLALHSPNASGDAHSEHLMRQFWQQLASGHGARYPTVVVLHCLQSHRQPPAPVVGSRVRHSRSHALDRQAAQLKQLTV